MNQRIFVLPADERDFVKAVARYALERKIQPADAMRLFGAIVRVMVEVEASLKGDQSDAEFARLTSAAFDKIAHGFGATGNVEVTAATTQKKEMH